MRLLLLFLALSIGSYSAFCQDNKFVIDGQGDGELEFILPDSLRHLALWHPRFKDEFKFKVTPAVSMTSVVLVEGNEFPTRVDVINKKTLRLFYRAEISSGQAWNWGPFPDSYLDARTLSFPMPR